MNFYKGGTIVVSLSKMTSTNNEVTIDQGTVDKVVAYGPYKHYNNVIRLEHHTIGDTCYFPHNKEGLFRLATKEETARFKLYRGSYNVCVYNIGDKVVALSDVTTVEGEYIVKAEEINTIVDIVINRKDMRKSIFWFDNHKGVFRMSDNFQLINE